MAGRDETWRDAEDTGSLNENGLFRWDRCDLLLDAIDVQLDQLQIQPPTEHNHIHPATLRWSKDTGLGSMTQTNDTSMSCLELIHTPVMKKTPEIAACFSARHNETKKRLKGSSSDEEEDESERDQLTWRLQRLLGDVCQEGTSGETHPASDSVCTEDLIWCFREEVVDLSLSDSLEQLNNEGKTEISDSDTKPRDQNRQVAECGVNVSQVQEGAGGGEKSRAAQRREFSYRTEVVTDRENVCSDSDVDAVCTERLKQHIHKWTGPVITDLTDDTTTQDETERLSASERSSSSGHVAKAQSNRTRTSSVDKSAAEKTHHRKEASTPGRTSEETDWNETKERLENFQQQLEQLSADTAQMEKEKTALESVLGDSRTEKESIGYQLQLQRDSCLLQIQNTSPHKQTLKEESCKNKKQNKAVMSEVEMERQLDCTQTELFAKQQRAREKLESLQEKERETLKRELQNLKPPNHKELKEGQEQTCVTPVRTEQEFLLSKPVEVTHHWRAQQSEETVLQLRQDVQLAVRESDRLWAMLEEKTRAHERFRAETEQQLRLWAQQLAAEVKHLHLLVDRDPSQSFTVAEAVAHLRTTREHLEPFVRRLHQELDSQKQMNEQLRKEKEQELRFQRRQLRAERDQALNAIRTRLIQEHVEELSSLQCAHVSETGGVAACLRRQLQDKDLELRQLQRSMAEWKRRTAARLASQFEHQLTSELERCKVTLIRSRRASKAQEVRPEGEGTLSTKKTVCSHWLHAVDSAAAHVSTDVFSLKLLRHLQGKVKQLRVENQAFMWSSNPPDPLASNI